MDNRDLGNSCDSCDMFTSNYKILFTLFGQIKILEYFNFLIIFLIYVLFDVWFLTTISMTDEKVWWIFILINISGITAIYRTYKEIKNINKK